MSAERSGFSRTVWSPRATTIRCESSPTNKPRLVRRLGSFSIPLAVRSGARRNEKGVQGVRANPMQPANERLTGNSETDTTRNCVYPRSRNPLPAKIAGAAFSIRVARVAACFAPAM